MEDEPRRGPPWFKMFFALLWALPWSAVGVLIGITVIGLPISFLLLGIGCWPLAKVIQNHLRYISDWRDRDHALQNDEPKPWEEEE